MKYFYFMKNKVFLLYHYFCFISTFNMKNYQLKLM